MKLIPIVILILHICFIEAVNVHSKADKKGSNDEDMVTSAGKESHNKAVGVKTKTLKKEMKRDVKSKDMHTVTKRSTSNITVTDCYKTITGFQRPFYIQIVCNEVFLTEHGTKCVHVLDVKTGSSLRKFAVPVGHNPKGLFVKGNRVLVTDHNHETYSFSLSGDLIGVHYSYHPSCWSSYRL